MTTTADTTNLVLENRSYADAVARNIWKTLPRRVEFDEVQAFAYLGLTQAARLYDPWPSVLFRSFAYPRIRGAVFDGLAKMMGVSKQLSAKDRELRRIVTQGAAANDVCQQVHEDCFTAGNEEQRAICFRSAIRQLGMVFLVSSSSHDEDSGEFKDHADPVAELMQRELTVRIRELIPQLPSEEAMIIREFYFEGRSLTECAAKLGKHKSGVSRLHARALARLREALDPSATRALPAA